MLLKAANQAPRGLTIYGQENDVATWALARMNMILHGHATAGLDRGNTLADPKFKAPDGGVSRFDFSVANPPFSAKAWTNGLDPEHDQFKRFEFWDNENKKTITLVPPLSAFEFTVFGREPVTGNANCPGPPLWAHFHGSAPTFF